MPTLNNNILYCMIILRYKLYSPHISRNIIDLYIINIYFLIKSDYISEHQEK